MRLIFLSIFLFCLSCHAAVIEITDARSEDQRMILFHDQHRGTRNLISMKDLDKEQREPLWRFFKTLTKKKTPSLMLLELSRSERIKLRSMPIQKYAQKPFRKQLGFNFVQGTRQWASVTLDTWDERDQVHRQVSWLLANTIDTLVQIYQKKYECTAETTCLPWFDEHAAQDFFNNTAQDDPFHASLRKTVKSALLGKSLTKSERELGFWSVKPVLVRDYLRTVKEYNFLLHKLEKNRDIPASVIHNLRARFDKAFLGIKQLINAYAAEHSELRKFTMNDVILYHLMESNSLQGFDQEIYQPLSNMSVVLGDITLLKKISEAQSYDVVVVYAGNNHIRMVIKYLKARGFSVHTRAVSDLGSVNQELTKKYFE